ncbi:MAG TPA: PhzF family phenazine biosynthesis protein [Pusillimonas sp.]
MKLSIFYIDAFTDQRFKGNPAAVVPLNTWLPEADMQAIATENNLSETAFFVREDGKFLIRWFSPMTEITFCGHATLASAYVMFKHDMASSPITFWAKAVGDITVSQLDNGLIEMNFPNRAPTPVTNVPPALLQGLSIPPAQVLKNQQAYIAVYESQDDVTNVVPDLEQLKKLAPLDLAVTAPGDRHDFASRYFWPANGGGEDPVTGSIHAGLAPYWAQRLGRSRLVALQASRRTGELNCRVDGDRVYVAGSCVQYLEGTIIV